MADQPGPALAGATFDFRGRTYFLPRVIADEQDAMESWACARALAKVRAMRPHQTAAENARDYDAALLRVGAGLLAWDEAGGEAARLANDGLTYLCWLCLHRHDNEVSLEDVKAMVKEKGFGFLWDQYYLANLDPTVRSSAAGASGDNSGPGSPSGGASTPNGSAASPTPKSATTT